MKNVPDYLQTEELLNTDVDLALQQVWLSAEKAKGSYLTLFDRLLLEFLYTEEAVIGTEELWMALKGRGVKISIATVQLCLNRFHRCGILFKQKLDGEKRYRYSIIGQP